jgi:hypothetical protein
MQEIQPSINQLYQKSQALTAQAIPDGRPRTKWADNSHNGPRWPPCDSMTSIQVCILKKIPPKWLNLIRYA